MTSKIKVDNINKVSDDSNIIKKCGTTITLGASGDSIALASGASQSGFGRSGSVNWQTGSIKTSTFTAVNGEGYFVNTSGGVVTANLPAGSAGAIVAFSDYTRTFATNAFTISPNGSEKIGGVADDVVLNVNGQALTLVYVDATEGWINVQNAEDTEIGELPAFIAASGGNSTATVGDFKIHTFTSPGTFTVSCAGNSKGSNTVSYLVVAGGGGSRCGGCGSGGGGGGGGFREGLGVNDSYTGSPLRAPTGVPVTATGFPIAVGAGGAAGNPAPAVTRGINSTFSTITSTGGGAGLNGIASPLGPGGSGAGGSAAAGSPGPGNNGGLGNTPPVSPPQGNTGGTGFTSPVSAGPTSTYRAGGGGGAGAVGGNAPPTLPQPAGSGGAGAATSINNSATTYAGGGGGGGGYEPGGVNPGDAGGPGGAGGGGKGSNAGAGAVSGTANTGGGGGGGSYPSNTNTGGAGGSGIVIIRYKFQ